MAEINGYKLIQPVGQGTQAQVYHAEKSGHFYALKLFAAGQAPAAQAEADALAGLRHPNVVGLVETGTSQGRPYLVTDWVEGESLETAAPPTEWPQLRELALEMSRGLEAIHRQGLVHGDVKGANLLIQAGHAVLVDLGFARPATMAEAAPAGTLAHLAPELLFGHPPGPGSDLYALGMTLYRWLRGEYPFPLHSAAEVIRWHLFETPLQPMKPGALPAEFGDFILSLLAKSPADRPRSVAAALSRFAGLFGLEAVSTLEEEPPEAGGFELYGEAIRFYEAKVALSEEEKILLAELYHRQGHPAKALAALGETRGPAAAILRGKVLTRMGNFAEAEREFAALQDSKIELTPGQRLSLLNARGILQYYRGEVAAAGAAFEAAESWARAIGEIAPLAVAYNNLGNILLEQGRATEAEDSIQRSLALSREAGDRIHEGMFQMSYAYLLHRRGRAMPALSAYGESLRLLEILGQKSEAARTRLNRANLLLSLGDLAAAQADLAEAQRTFRRRAMRYLLVYSRQIEGELLRKTRRHQEAAGLFQECRRELVALQRPADARWALLHEGECRVEAGDAAAADLVLAEAARELPDAEPRWRGHFHFLRARRRWLGGEPEAEVLEDFRAAEGLLGEGEDDEARVLVHFAWGAYLSERGRGREARGHLELAKQGLQRLSAALPEEWRARYLQNSPAGEIERMLNPMETLNLPSRAGAESAVSRDRAFESELRDLQRELVGELDLSALVEKILDRMIALTKAERGFILLREEAGPRIAVSRNLDQAKFRKSDERISWSIAAEVLETGKPLVTVDALEDERFSVTASIHQLKLRSILCLPLKREGEILGAIYLDNRERGGVFQPALAAALQPFAEWMGQLLANARRFFEVERDLRQVQKKLEAAEGELKIKYDYRNIVGRHPKMLEIFQVLDRVTDVEVPVLILGESGVGKERIARAIHFNGARAARSFVSLNCQAVPEGLFESELFGHVRGAFTGAVADRVGLVEQAHRGTLFLDEIGDMPLALQGKLLRVLQEGRFRPVGAKEEKPVDCRVLAATHQNLRQLIQKGKFREDLWFRLNVVEIQVPPLRERMEDLPLLADHFLAEFARRHGGKKKKLPPKSLELLSRYSWPGNVRELENTLTNACVFAPGESLVPEAFRYKRELFGREAGGGGAEAAVAWEDFGSFREALQAFEKKVIQAALEKSRGNITHAAMQLKIARPQLSRLIKKYRIAVP
ncbi:MAG: sigma 54-interacting transcriptional regulator [bacterium]